MFLYLYVFLAFFTACVVCFALFLNAYICMKGSLEIDRLQEEQEELQCRLQVSQSHSHQQQDVDTVQAMRRLLNQQDEVHEQLESQKESLVHLEQEILSMEKKLAGLRRTRTSVNLKQKSEASEKKKATRTLENKLDRTLVRFNEQLTKNAQLRADLETLRLERVRFQQLQRKLDKELQAVHRDIRDTINRSTVAYDVRVEAQSKMALLKEKAVKDLAQYSAEMKELERIIAHEQHLKDFMSTKSSDRSGHGGSLDPTHSQEPEERDHKRTEKGEDMVDSLEEVFHRIQSMTGEEDLDLLVSKFIQTEEQNFALFNYVNEQNNEAESLKDQIKQVQQEMGQFQAEEESQEARHCSLLTDIDTQQRKTEVRVQSYESQATEASKILDQIKTGVGRMFHKLECDFSVLEDMLGSSTEIRESNIMTYLSLVENRTNDLLSMQVFLNSKNLGNNYDEKDVPWFLLSQSLDIQPENLLIQPPSAGDDIETEASLVTDEDDRPLTQKELRQRILTEVLQKEAAACSAGETDDKDSTINMVSSQQRRFQDLSLDVSPSLL
uniref:Outer dynein arm docking complex subunit 1 n=1 Tax=Scleropages formosus TaxID=113540 RepID=A0A8C9TDR6_SCLFO